MNRLTRIVRTTPITMEDTIGMNKVNDPLSTTRSPGNRPSSLRPGTLGAKVITAPINASARPAAMRKRPSCSKTDTRPLSYPLFLNALVDAGGNPEDHHEQPGEEHDDDDQCNERKSALNQRRKPIRHSLKPLLWQNR